MSQLVVFECPVCKHTMTAFLGLGITPVRYCDALAKGTDDEGHLNRCNALMKVVLDARPLEDRGTGIPEKEAADRARVLKMFHAGIDMILSGRSAAETLEYTGGQLRGITKKNKSLLRCENRTTTKETPCT